jgi:hypothetical protein
MRELLFSLVLVGVGGATAAAQPVTRPARACELTITRAPEAVRATIEAWVRAEPHCGTSLELRVVPTDGGFYLLAREGNGRIRERIVPDAQSAGVLVASWMADDGPSPGAAAYDAPAEAPPPAHAAEAPPPDPAPAPPSTVAVVRPAPSVGVAVAVASGERSRKGRAISFGGFLNAPEIGVRGVLDLARRGGWTIGVGLTLNLGPAEGGDTHVAGIESRGQRVVAQIGRSLTRGKWSLRVDGGLGVQHVYDFFTVAEASLTLARAVTPRWSLVGGPVAMKVLSYGGVSVFDDAAMDVLPDVSWTMFAGVRRKL